MIKSIGFGRKKNTRHMLGYDFLKVSILGVEIFWNTELRFCSYRKEA